MATNVFCVGDFGAENGRVAHLLQRNKQAATQRRVCYDIMVMVWRYVRSHFSMLLTGRCARTSCTRTHIRTCTCTCITIAYLSSDIKHNQMASAQHIAASAIGDTDSIYRMYQRTHARLWHGAAECVSER